MRKLTGRLILGSPEGVESAQQVVGRYKVAHDASGRAGGGECDTLMHPRDAKAPSR